jgi:serine/threonine-protein kinase
MQPHSRYSILGTLGTGAFATVYRAYDRELGREVAIKQIHDQYLHDPARLESYWREAQLLAGIHHPCVMTIFDIVRDRGWLVLELLEGSIQQKLHGDPIRLDDLRLLLNYMLHALHCLHGQGILHGDIKPGNLLLDRHGGIKLGDFGIARRVHDDRGSVMKGTTRYIAPEVLAAQFGEVGPASDLYSLGFTAYELLCGKQFDVLFPELETFGRDPQISWMMWHASRDLRLPPVASVLEGVPPDIAKVVDRLIEKEPKKRYPSAAHALADLKQEGVSLLPNVEVPVSEEEEAAAQAKVRNRRLALAAFGVSAALSLVVAFWPAKKPEPPPVVVEKELPSKGTVAHIDVRAHELYMKPDNGETTERLDIGAADRILLNDAVVELAALRPGDALNLRRFNTATGERVLEITAWRQAEKEASGKVETVDTSAGKIRVRLDDPSQPPLELTVPENAQITLNAQPQLEGHALGLADIQPDDKVVGVRYAVEPEKLIVSSLDLVRLLHGSGTIIAVPAKQQRKLQIQLADTDPPKTQSFDVPKEVQITLNGAASVDGKAVTIASLAVGDRVTFAYDMKLTRVEASRGLSNQGVVKKLDLAGRKLTLQLDGRKDPVEFAIPEEMKLENAEGQTLPWTRLRPGDSAWVAHDSIDLKSPVAKQVRATIVADPRAWAMILGQRQYDDPALGSLPNVERDVAALRAAFVDEYRIPADQVLVQQDATRDRLVSDITAFLGKVKSDSQLFVVFEGCGVLDADKQPVLAVKDTFVEQASASGLKLSWLIDQLDACSAREKLLLLDTAPSNYEGKSSLSGSALARAIKRKDIRGITKNVTIVSATDDAQTNVSIADSKLGLWTQTLAKALAGEADSNGDLRLDRGELLGYLKREAPRLAALAGSTQTPVVFLPDPTPPRISEDGRLAMYKLLGGLEANMPIDVLEGAYDRAKKLNKGQPEPEVAYGLVLLKGGKTTASLPVFERIRREYPDAVIAYEALAWQLVLLGRKREAMDALEQMVTKLPRPAPGQEWDAYSRHLLEFAGGLRTFSLYAADPPVAQSQTTKLDNAVIELGDAAKEHYGQGVQQVRAEVKKIDDELSNAPADFDQSSLKFQRRLLAHYLKFDFKKAGEAIKLDLEK